MLISRWLRQSRRRPISGRRTTPPRDGEPAAAVAVVGDHPNLRSVERVDQAVFAGGTHAARACPSVRRSRPKAVPPGR
jgi:hypothetical protein